MGTEVDAAYFDFKKAFDLFHDDILLAKLSSLGCKLLKFMSSHLENRKQYVQVVGFCSGDFSQSGVSQVISLQHAMAYVFIVNPRLLREVQHESSSSSEPRENLYRILKTISTERNKRHNDSDIYYYSHALRAKVNQDEVNEQIRLKKEKIRADMVNKSHMKRYDELTKFLKTNIMSTEYFYNEMLRILRQRRLKDNLRLMVDYLQNRPEMKRGVLKCFYDLKEEESKKINIWKKYTPNNLVINHFGQKWV